MHTVDENDMRETQAAFGRLYEVIQTLRAPGGCPWDREQTPLTLRSDLLEETCEAIDAISQGDGTHAKEELGDVFLNTTMIGYMYQQRNEFTVADALNEVADKLIRRHPHVFPQSEGAVNALEGGAKTTEEVLTQWDAIKRGVEGRSEKSVLDEVPKGFPPLLKTTKMHKKAAKAGFDWASVDDVWVKYDEELAELREAIADLDKIPGAHTGGSASAEAVAAQSHVEDEFGDVFASLVNVARFLKIDPDVALVRHCEKFYGRFTFLERKARENGTMLKDATLEQQLEWWKEAKAQGL